MAYFASRTKHGRSLARPQPGRLGLASHNDRSALRKTCTFTLVILLWTTGQHCMLPVTARDTTRQQPKVPILSSRNGAHETLFTPVAVQGETNGRITEVPFQTNRRSPVSTSFKWGLRSHGSNAFSPGKRPDEKTSVLMPPASVEDSNTQDGPAELKRSLWKTGALLGQKEGFEAEKDKVSLPSEGGKQIESEEITLETAAIPDDKAEAKRRAASTGLGKRMLQRTNKVGISSDVLLPHVNSSDLLSNKGSAEYSKDRNAGVPTGSFPTAPGVKHSTGQISRTSSYKDRKHTARATDLLVGHHQVEGLQSIFGATAEGSDLEDRQEADSGPAKASMPGVVTGENMTSRKKGRRVLGKQAVEKLQVRTVINEGVNIPVSLGQAADRTRGSETHTKGVDETHGKPARRLAGDIDETIYEYIPSEEYMTVEDHMPGIAFAGGEGLVHAPHFQYPLWYHDPKDHNLHRESESQSRDDVSEWVDASSLEPGFHYPSLHRLADPERHNDVWRLEDDIEKAISGYMPSEENLATEEDAADDFPTMGYFGREPNVEYNPSNDSPTYFDLNRRLQGSEGSEYMVDWKDQVSPERGLQFASGYSILDGEDDFDEAHGEVGGEENLFVDASGTYPYAAESFPHVQHFGAHKAHSSGADASDFVSAAPGPWPTPHVYYANDPSDLFNHVNTQTPSWSSPYNYYTENISGAVDHFNAPTPSWSSPYNDYSYKPAGLFESLDTPTPSWSSPYIDHSYNPSGHFESFDMQAPSPSSPSSMHYDSHFWDGGYDDDTKNPFGDDFIPTMIDYSDWASPTENFYPNVTADDDVDYFPVSTYSSYVE